MQELRTVGRALCPDARSGVYLCALSRAQDSLQLVQGVHQEENGGGAEWCSSEVTKDIQGLGCGYPGGEKSMGAGVDCRPAGKAW